MAHWLPRKRTILGGTLATGLIAGGWLALWISGNLPHMGSGIGLGTGGDNVIGKTDTSKVAVQATEGSLKSGTAKDTDEHGPKPKRADEEPLDDVLTILVEDRHYAVWRKTRKGNGYFPAELNELVQLALDAMPNDEGLRVRIIRSKTARVTAWQKLQSELVQAGVPAEAIMLRKDVAQ